MRIYELFDEISENYESVAPQSFPEAKDADVRRIKAMTHEKLDMTKKKKHFGKKFLILAAAVVAVSAAVIGTVIVTGQSDVEVYRDNGYGEYLGIYRELCTTFANDGVSELDESSPYRDMPLNSDPAKLAQEMAKQEMINRIYEAAKPYSEAISENDPNTYYSDRAAYYEFITECCRLYKGHDLSEEDKGRILWLILQDYYSVEGNRRTLRGDEFHTGYIGPIDLESIKPQREEALKAVEEIVSGLREKNLIPAEEKAPKQEGLEEYNEHLNEKREKLESELEALVNEGVNEYMGKKGLNKETYKTFAYDAAVREIKLETFEMVKKYGKAKDMDESVVDAPENNDPEKWIKHCEYLIECHDLYYSGELSGYERYCISSAMSDLPEKLEDTEANKLLQTARVFSKEISTEIYMNYMNKYNEWLAAQDPSFIEELHS